jgi:hypothetical protein
VIEVLLSSKAARLARAARSGAAVCVVMGSLGAAVAHASPNERGAPNPSFSTMPQLDPSFQWAIHDYAIRCDGNPVKVSVTTPGDWLGKVGSGGFHDGNFVVSRPLMPGRALTVTFHRPGQRYLDFHVRCLPTDFPAYQFTRTRPGGPGFFVVQMQNQYATIFDRNGVPVWWYKASGAPNNAELLPDGTIAFAPVNEATFGLGAYQIHRLDGSLVRDVKPVGLLPDIHELLLLPNGNYLLGAKVHKSHVDTSPYGGSSNATVVGFQIQEVTPGGKLVWKWNSLAHIGLDQTPTRWWDMITQRPQPYDIEHWNSAELDGKNMLLSFRHLDAVYEINRKTGGIVWKLGGTPTSKSLDVLNDPESAYPLGAQHDARRDPDGTITIHDNFSYLGKPPRVVRYRVDPQAGTARLVQSISDPEATSSICCGSARRLPSGDWLVGWGGIPFVGAYNAAGQRIFKLDLVSGFSYRSFPVPPHALTAGDLRSAMNAMSAG